MLQLKKKPRTRVKQSLENLKIPFYPIYSGKFIIQLLSSIFLKKLFFRYIILYFFDTGCDLLKSLFNIIHFL